MDNFNQQSCRDCGKPLLGRIDKRFCDAYCRNAYNNQNKAKDERSIQEINRRIRANRRILKILCPQGKATVRKEVLEKMGYDFRQFTGLFKSSSTLYYPVYDYAFAPVMEGKNKKVLAVQKQDYMNKLGYEMWKS